MTSLFAQALCRQRYTGMPSEAMIENERNGIGFYSRSNQGTLVDYI